MAPPQRVEAGTARLAAALSLLRLTHDHHGDLRAMEATTTSRVRIDREHPVVTRHGSRSPHAATLPSRRMHPGTPFIRISANVLGIGRGRFPIHAPPGEKSRNLTHQLANASADPATQRSQPSKTRNPHRPSPQPRGFVLGRFRFPYASPVPGRATDNGRRPKTFTTADLQSEALPPRGRANGMILATGSGSYIAHR